MKLTTTLLLATLAAALTIGAAASLVLAPDDLGAGGRVVSSCDATIDVRLVTAPDDARSVVGVEVSNVSLLACFNHSIAVVLADDDGLALAEVSGRVRSTTVDLELTAPVPSSAVESVNVTITG